jgi:pilus assembly protein CpaB
MVIACLLALPIVFLYNRAGQPEVPEGLHGDSIETPSDTVPVVTAKVNLEQYTRITEQHLETKDYPAGMIPQEATVSTSDVIGKEVIEEIYQGEMITLSRVQDPGEAVTSISSFLEKGERAITITVNAISGSGGFIQQGDIVDVVAKIPAQKDETVETIISNIKVMAVGGDYRRRLRKNRGKTIKGADKTVRITLAVTSRMANKIQHLEKRTQFRLILKNPKDTSEVETDGWKYSRLKRENVPPEYLPPEKPESLKYLVTVIRGVSPTKEAIAIEIPEEEPGL